MTFRRVDIHPQIACEVVGFLYSSDDPRDLGQDMLEVRLPNGIRINAGWYPEGSPAGCYRISVGGAYELPPVEREDIDEVAREIETLIARLSNRSVQWADSGDIMSDEAAALLHKGLAQARAGKLSRNPPELEAHDDL